MGLSWWTTVVLTPFKLDGLALGAFLAVMVRQPGGLDWLVRGLPRVAAVVGGLAGRHLRLDRPGVARGAGAGRLRSGRRCSRYCWPACWCGLLIAPKQSTISRFFRSRVMVFLGTYSYGLYVYHHFISYYLTSNRTELELAQWLGSHGLAVALQATLGISISVVLAYLSYELFEKRFLSLKRRFETAKDEEAPADLAADALIRPYHAPIGKHVA